MKVAEIATSAVIVSVQVVAVPALAHAPPQPSNEVPTSGAAVKVSVVPSGTAAAQTPQDMPSTLIVVVSI